MGDSALVIRVYKTIVTPSQVTCTIYEQYSPETGVHLEPCEGLLHYTCHYDKSYTLTQSETKKKTLHNRISAYHRICSFRTLFISKPFLYLMLSQHSPIDDITSYLRKTHSNIHSV